MLAPRPWVRGTLALFVALSAAACGGGDDAESSDGGKLISGTCDRRSTNFSCIESKANAVDTENQKTGCDRADGTWSSEPCPTDELIGCCAYTYGNEFRECFYTGTPQDPVAYCMTWDDGVWTPA